MNIVHLINKPVPPTPACGGSNRSVDWLAKAQAKAGHQVYIVSPDGRDTDYFRHIECTEETPATELLSRLPADAELIHLHGGYPGIQAASRTLGLPFIQTIRANLGVELAGSSNVMYNAVFLSANHMQRHGGQRFIYNGIPVDDYRYSETKQRHLLFLAKVKRSKKGIDTAVQVANAAQYPLVVAGGRRLGTPATWLPLSRYVRAVGTVSGEQKLQLLAEASALLVPIGWDEPFGLTVPEALASGTPVIATRRGAMPELIESGKTGFLCDSIPEFENALTRLNEIAPANCRTAATERFSIERVRADYESVYEEILTGAQW